MSKLFIPDTLKVYLKGLRYDPAMRMDYQDFLLEDVLPGLFYLTRLGRRRGKGDWGGRTAMEVARELAQRTDKFLGFTGDSERRVLEEWLKASVLRLIERGEKDKVMSVRPLHFFTYRVDLPANWAHLRQVPEFIATILHRNPAQEPLNSSQDEPFALASRRNLFWLAFGTGIIPDDQLFTNADLDRYDDSVELDIESLLTIRVVDELQTPKEITVGKGGKGGKINGFEPLCPQQANHFREDCSLFLRAYAPPAVPVRVLGDHLLCFLALNLSVYSLSHFAASNHLYDTGEWLDDRQHSWDLDIFPDLTGGKHRKCLELARESFARHAAWMQLQLRTMVGFRLLEYYLRFATYIKEVKSLKTLKGIEFLKTLALGRQLSHQQIYGAVQAGALPVLAQLEQEQEREGGSWPEELQAIVDDPDLPPFDKLVELLTSSESEFYKKIMNFFTSSSRRNLDSGLLSGSPTRRTDNHYTLGLKLIETLVQLAILKVGDPPHSRPLDIYDFVDDLKDRYGIWIGAPPPSLDQSYEAHQAGQANFAALKEKLRQLGFFRAVTDARRMQRLTPRYTPLGDLKHPGGTDCHETLA